MHQYYKTSTAISCVITKHYSTSFYFASLFFPKRMREAIFNIYGFVRLADEIVDTFHQYNKKELLDNFELDLNKALESRISINPVLHSFQFTVNEYNIDRLYIETFLRSMRFDLEKQTYHTDKEIDEYIYGSAEVVGLMCLKVFCEGNTELFEQLQESAKSLGSAFQKVNFLRDLNSDVTKLNRTYFPQLTGKTLNEKTKLDIIMDIEHDFDHAFEGIKELPVKARSAVLIAYYYYKRLLTKIKRTPAAEIMQSRIRVSNAKKLILIGKAQVANKLIAGILLFILS